MLEAVVLLIGMLLVGNLLLTWGVVRRLRALQKEVGALFSPMQNGLRPGDAVPDFQAQALGGDTVTSQGLMLGEVALAFFSPTCDACEAHLPTVRRLARSSEGTATVIGIVDGTEAESTHLIEGLQGVRLLFAPREHNDLLGRYQVNAYPSYYLIGADGRITGVLDSLDEYVSLSEA